jgi:hypothetical protein
VAVAVVFDSGCGCCGSGCGSVAVVVTAVAVDGGVNVMKSWKLWRIRGVFCLAVGMGWVAVAGWQCGSGSGVWQ